MTRFAHTARRAAAATNAIAAVVISLGVLAAVVAIWSLDFTGESGSGLGDEFRYSPKRPYEPLLKTWRLYRRVETGLDAPSGIDILGDRVYVVGERKLQVYDLSASLTEEHPLEADGVRVTAGPDGSVYITAADRIMVRDLRGRPVDQWHVPGQERDLLAAAVIGDELFVSDYASRSVLVLSRADGTLVRTIDGKIEGTGGFKLPSRNFELAAGSDGLLRAVNPGELRVEAYSPQGRRRFTWGRGGEDIGGFSGCCNPVGLAFLPDGRVVTSEKSLPTIKVFTDRRDGTLDSVVAGLEMFETPNLTPWDLAVDGQGRIWAVVPKAGEVWVFEPAEQTDGSDGEE